MQVFHKLEEVPPDFGPAVVGVGNFDGVHRGHADVLTQNAARAREQTFQAVAVAFEFLIPDGILRPDGGLKLLTPTPEKLRLARRLRPGSHAGASV